MDLGKFFSPGYSSGGNQCRHIRWQSFKLSNFKDIEKLFIRKGKLGVMSAYLLKVA